MKKIISLQKIALLSLTTLTLFACGGGSSGGGSAPNPGGNGGGGGNPDETASTKIRISEATGDEGSMLTFKVIANPTIAKPINFSYSVNFDNSLSSSSATTSDINLNSLTGTSTIATNDSSVTISITTVNDNLRENAETFLVMLRDLSPTSDATFTDHTAIGTILANDDATGIVTISLVTDATASEENTGRINFQVKSEFTAISPFTFNYAVDLNNSSADTDDFAGATNGMATIPAGKDSTTISIRLKSDTMVEPDETFKLLLTNPTSPNATIDSAKNSAMGTILNDDLGEISGVTATPSARQVTLSWTNPNSNLFAGVTIAQQPGATVPNSCLPGHGVTIIDAQQTTSSTITGLTDGTTYSFRICARSRTDSHSSGVSVTNVTPDGDDDNDGSMNSVDVDDDNDGLIEISTAAEFTNIRHNLAGTGYKTNGGEAGNGNTTGCSSQNDGGCNGYELTASINLSSFNGGNWTPIGSSSDEFTAIFDGNNNQISNLTITGNNDYVGLFAALENATISNLSLATVNIAGGSFVGALVGSATNSTLSNIELIGGESQTEISTNGANVGGLAGSFSGTITDASSNLTVVVINNSQYDDSNRIGGLVGRLTAGSIKNSNSSGSVSVSGHANSVGGLVGQQQAGIISQSWASGNIHRQPMFNRQVSSYGGLVGFQDLGNISQSWASGNISLQNTIRLGGLVGSQRRNGSISQSWAGGDVISDRDLPGGLVGDKEGGISQVWTSGTVSGSNLVGGLVGRDARGSINGRNYQLDAATGRNVDLANDDGIGESFILERGESTADKFAALAALSGAASDVTSDYGTHSSWHAGFGNDPFTMFCNTNGDGTIDINEKVATNSVWVMPGADPSNDSPPAPTTAEDGQTPRAYYAIPAIRCIANTAGITDQTEIDRLRKIEIDRQRHKFPQ